MEAAFIAFMTGMGFTFSEVLKMLVLVGFCFIFQGIILWRFRKPITEFFTSVSEAMKAVPEVKKDIHDLNRTLEDHVKLTNERLVEGNQKFEQQSREIKELSEIINKNQEQNAKQFAEMVRQVRYLYTRGQISMPENGEEEQQQIKSKED